MKYIPPSLPLKARCLYNELTSLISIAITLLCYQQTNSNIIPNFVTIISVGTIMLSSYVPCKRNYATRAGITCPYSLDINNG